MPLAIISRDPSRFADGVCSQMAPVVQGLIAAALSTPDDESTKLTAEEIEIRFRDVGPLDVNASPLAVEIFANDSPARRMLVDDGAAQKIASEMRTLLRETWFLGDNSFVWIFLGYGGFSRI